MYDKEKYSPKKISIPGFRKQKQKQVLFSTMADIEC